MSQSRQTCKKKQKYYIGIRIIYGSLYMIFLIINSFSNMMQGSCLEPYTDFEIESLAKRIMVLIVFISCLPNKSDENTPMMASFQVNL